MSATDPRKTIDQVSRSVSRARSLFITASLANLNECEAELMTAMETLKNLQQQLQGQNEEDRTDLVAAAQQIQREIVGFSALLAQAQDFHAGWSGLLEAKLAGYTESGAPAQVDRHPTRIAMRG